MMMLKKYYGELIPINADKIKEKFSLSDETASAYMDAFWK